MEKWIVRPKDQPDAAVRLFCFPYAGAGATAFRNWSEELGQAIEVCCVQLPGRESRWREQPASSIGELIPRLMEGLAPWLDRPFAFYGHSLGARVAFEMAHELRRIGACQPNQLLVGACPSPQSLWPWPPLRWLADDDFLDEIQFRYGGTPKQILAEPELRAALLPALRADVTMMETLRHIARVPLDCPITAFGGTNDPMVEAEALQGWREQTQGNFALHLVDGDHFFLQSRRQWLLSQISTDLARFREPRRSIEAYV